MGAIDRGLAPQEHILLHRHPHWKTLIRPVAVMVLTVAAAIVASALVIGSTLSNTTQTVIGIAAGALSAIVMIWWGIVPIVRWATTHFAITNKRIMFRTGVLTTSGIDIPLARINSVQFRHVFWDRLFRTGTLIIESASDEPLEFDDIPRVESVHAMIYTQLNAAVEDDHR
jgi:uncharacterized membrane protein YdbT with pleckstrin-like domain